MLTMNIENKLEKLKNILQVDAPPFLFTRIKESINTLQSQPAPVKWRLAFGAAAMLVLFLNVFAIFNSDGKMQEGNLDEVVRVMQLSTSNDFYHE
jgi:hypothetical protein